MKRRFQAVKGTRDILPPASALWNHVEQTARRVFAAYNFHEIRLPLFERSDLFACSVGEETDIVAKEMYRWIDSPRIADALDRLWRVAYETAEKVSDSNSKVRQEFLHLADANYFDPIGKRVRISLRPEATASVVRAYIEHKMYKQPGLAKLYYIGPMFRRERPQKGRYRQFYQIGAEVLGPSDHPALDAEIIELVLAFIEKCGLRVRKAGSTEEVLGTRQSQSEAVTLYVNSIGCTDPAQGGEACRKTYIEKLRAELQKVKSKLGPDSQRRVETNPLRVLDSKVEAEQAVIAKLPSILDHLCGACRKHYQQFKLELSERGITFQENPRLVRGLDYYLRTTFEITAPGLGAQDAICGGGRYDGLLDLLGAPRGSKGTGWALGLDRFLLALEAAKAMPAPPALDVFIAWMGAATYDRARALAGRLRAAGLSTELPYDEVKLRKALDRANKLGARYVVLIGEDEVKQDKFTLRDMAAGMQRTLKESELLSELAR